MYFSSKNTQNKKSPEAQCRKRSRKLLRILTYEPVKNNNSREFASTCDPIKNNKSRELPLTYDPVKNNNSREFSSTYDPKWGLCGRFQIQTYRKIYSGPIPHHPGSILIYKIIFPKTNHREIKQNRGIR